MSIRSSAVVDPWVPTAVSFMGVVSVAVGLGLDLIGGVPGLGRVQIAFIVVGALTLVLGLGLFSRPGQRRIQTMPMPDGDGDPLGVLLLAVWFGALAGLLDPLVIHVQNGLGHRFAYVNQHMSWMSPVSYTALFLIVISPLLLLGHGRLKWLQSRRTAATLLSFITTTSLLLLYQPEIIPIISAFVAAGVATQTWRILRTRDKSMKTFVRRTIAPVLGLILLSVGLQVVKPWASERAVKGRADQANSSLPNVLLIVLDTVRGANVSVNGYGRPTMDDVGRRADADGVVFERAIATASWSLPSHVSLVTGLYPHDFQADWVSPLEETMPTLAEVLGERGYFTAGFFANRTFGGRQAGLQRGFHHWDVDMMTPIEIFGASHFGRMFLEPRRRLKGGLHNLNQFAQKDGVQVTREFLEWVEGADDMPFFAFLNYFDAHSPYLLRPGYEDHFADIERPTTPFLGLSNPDVTPGEVENYDRAIAFLDDEIESILTRLEALGKLENTIVVITSDHGEEFGERPGSSTGHGRSLSYSVVHVPLVVIWPGRVVGGSRVESPVTIRDIPATILDLVGVEEDHGLAGSSLRPLWEDREATDRDPARLALVLAEVTNRQWLTADSSPLIGNAIALFEKDLHYLRVGDQYEELYDLALDPWELTDLSKDSTQSDALGRFRSLTDSIADLYMPRQPMVKGEDGRMVRQSNETSNPGGGN